MFEHSWYSLQNLTGVFSPSCFDIGSTLAIPNFRLMIAWQHMSSSSDVVLVEDWWMTFWSLRCWWDYSSHPRTVKNVGWWIWGEILYNERTSWYFCTILPFLESWNLVGSFPSYQSESGWQKMSTKSMPGWPKRLGTFRFRLLGSFVLLLSIWRVLSHQHSCGFPPQKETCSSWVVGHTRMWWSNKQKLIQ